MKKCLAILLMFTLLSAMGTAWAAEEDDGELARRCDTLTAFLNGDPELTPDQAQASLDFLNIARTPLNAIGSKDRDEVMDAFRLLGYILEHRPDLLKRLSAAIPTGTPEGEAKPYVLNIRTNRFHQPGCTGIKEMTDKNRVDFVGPRDLLLATGFQPCQMCRP